MTNVKNPLASNKNNARAGEKLIGAVTHQILKNQFTTEEANWLNSASEATLNRRIKSVYNPVVNTQGMVKTKNGIYIPEKVQIWHEGWVEFYKKFGVAIDLNDYPILPNIVFEEGQDYWTIITAPGMNPQTAFEIRKQLTQTYESTSVKKIIDVFPKVPVVVVKANQNAKIERLNMSCNKSIQQGIWGTTFTEGMLLDGRVFDELKIHLDVDGWTMHNGSRSGDGYVVFSRWSSGVGLSVVGDSLDDEYACLSLRSKQF